MRVGWNVRWKSPLVSPGPNPHMYDGYSVPFFTCMLPSNPTWRAQGAQKDFLYKYSSSTPRYARHTAELTRGLNDDNCDVCISRSRPFAAVRRTDKRCRHLYVHTLLGRELTHRLVSSCSWRRGDQLVRYGTIMSVSCGSPRVNYFSNPDVIHLNKPTGTPTEDNARVIEDNMVRGKEYCK